jgi:hypothetical protein
VQAREVREFNKLFLMARQLLKSPVAVHAMRAVAEVERARDQRGTQEIF